MFRRIFCLFCAALLLFSVSTASAAKAPAVYSYDFDLTFALNAEAFPPLIRERISGYAELLGSIGLKGNFSQSPDTASMDLDAELYYTSKPSLRYPFRIYGARSRLFVTSPLLDNQDLFFDLNALLPFCVKTQNTLGIPLPYFAFLYPYTTEYMLKTLTKYWDEIIAPSRETGIVTIDQFEALSEQWAAVIQENAHVRMWIDTLMGMSEAPGTVETEFDNLPRYYEIVTGGEPLSITVDKDSELWQDASGNTLFARRTESDYSSLVLSLPASANGYIPRLSVRTQTDEQTKGFSLSASVIRDPDFSPGASAYADDDYDFPYTDEGEYDEEYDEEVVEDGDEEYEEEVIEEEEESDSAVGSSPDRLLSLRAAGNGFPRKLPADSTFSVSASVEGAVYPNYAFFLQGSTKKDGTVSVSLYKPGNAETAPVEIFRISGTVLPSEREEAPDFRKKSLKEAYNIFSMNEQSLAEFTRKMVPLAVKGLLSFVAEAPTAACQALLDDLTDFGVLGMLMN